MTMENDDKLARGLGWFSIGLGVASLIAPRTMARTIGVKDDSSNQNLLRFIGIREIVSGLGILSQPRPVEWVWSRVAGDAMDIALLGKALSSDNTAKAKTGMATAAVVGITVLDLCCGQQLSRRSNGASNGKSNGASNGFQGDRARKDKAVQDRGKDVTQTVTINRSPEELYQYWHDFENLPRFMNHLEAVQMTGEKQSHWKAKAPAGQTVEWDAEVVEDSPNERIAWRSLPGADVDNAGEVRFKPAHGGRGTVVQVQMKYSPPGGAVGAGIAKLLGEEPEKQVWEDLHRFKQIMELGEIVRSDAALEGMGSSQGPGRPSASLAAV